MTPSALVFAPEAPFPTIGGGALRTASLVHYLARGYAVDLIVFRQPGAPDPRPLVPSRLVRDIAVLDLAPNSRTAAARAFRNAHRLVRGAPPLVDRFSGFAPQVARHLAGRHYDLALVEHFWCAPYAEVLGPYAARLLLDLHNIESALHASCAAAEAGPAALAHRVFERACRRLERQWLPRYAGVLVASGEDAARLGQFAPGLPVTVYPNAIPCAPAPLRAPEDAIVFSGNLEYHPNVSAVRYFVREIWPRLRERFPRLVWRLLGRNPGAVRRYVAGDPRIELIGEVPDAIVELARAQVAVVPLLAGSGTRFKILEAWAAGTPVVSTRMGAEGLPVRDGDALLLADAPAEFAGAVARVIESPALGQQLAARGRAVLEAEFTWEAAWRRLPF